MSVGLSPHLNQLPAIYEESSDLISDEIELEDEPYEKRPPLPMTFSGAENGTRTRDLNLGKVALYQLSYFRKVTFQV